MVSFYVKHEANTGAQRRVKRDAPNDTLEALVFFGSEPALAELNRVAQTAMQVVSGYSTPDGYAKLAGTAERPGRAPCAAWCRWLCGRRPEDFAAFRAHWSKRSANECYELTLRSPDDYDPTDATRQASVPKAFPSRARRRGCLAMLSRRSIFSLTEDEVRRSRAGGAPADSAVAKKYVDILKAIGDGKPKEQLYERYGGERYGGSIVRQIKSKAKRVLEARKFGDAERIGRSLHLPLSVIHAILSFPDETRRRIISRLPRR